MPDTQAISPDNSEFMRFVKDMRKENKKKNELPDEHIAQLAETQGWEELREWLLKRKSRLLELGGYDLNGASYEEMGKLFYFAKLVSEEIDLIISKVETTRKVVEESK